MATGCNIKPETISNAIGSLSKSRGIGITKTLIYLTRD